MGFGLNPLKRFIEKNRDSNLILNIIGDGPEFKVLYRYIIKNNFSHRILRGAIFDDYVLKNYFERAICLISPGQAGLTVLKSFAYGIPFVTKYNAITEASVLILLMKQMVCFTKGK